MSHYLKKFLFTALVFMMPYMDSASKAMDTEDHEESTICVRKISFVTEDQQDVQSFAKQSTFSQTDSLEDPQNSWISYVSSPVKSVLHGAYTVVDFSIKNPKIAMFVGLSYMISAAAAANCTGCYQCMCTCYREGIGPQQYGKVPDVNSCINVCGALQWSRFLDCKSL